MKKEILAVGMCLVLVLIVFSSGCVDTKEKEYEEGEGGGEVTSGELSILDHHMDVEGSSVYVRGHAKNIGEKQLSWASVDVKFYDADGSVVGTGSDYTQDLDPGETWSFEVWYYDPDWEVDSYKIAVGSCW